MKPNWEGLPEAADRAALDTLHSEMGSKRFGAMVRSVVADTTLQPWEERMGLALELEEAWGVYVARLVERAGSAVLQRAELRTSPDFHAIAASLLRQWQPYDPQPSTGLAALTEALGGWLRRARK